MQQTRSWRSRRGKWEEKRDFTGFGINLTIEEGILTFLPFEPVFFLSTECCDAATNCSVDSKYAYHEHC
jgi:hypothetical protein